MLSALAIGTVTLSPMSPASAWLLDEVTVTSVSPTLAAVGTSVNVSGTGFSSVPAENEVAVNGKPAAVTDNLWWWSESTASWAAAKAIHALPDPMDDENGYTQELNKFLERTDKQFDESRELPGLGPEYGAFPFATFLEQQIGSNAVLDIMKDISAYYVYVREPTDVIRSYLGDHDTSFETQIERFRWSTYVLDAQFGLGFEPQSEIERYWRQRLLSPSQGTVLLPEARVPFESHEAEASEPIDGTVDLESSGSAFIEVHKPDGQEGILLLQVDAGDDDIRASAARTRIIDATPGGKRSALCTEPQRIDIEDGTGLLEVPIDPTCPTVVLHINNTDNTSDGIDHDDVTWHATFQSDGAMLDGGKIQIGVNPYGALISGGVGLRRNDQLQTEVLAQGCSCEGWGIRGSDSGSPGGAYFEGYNGGLYPKEFTTTTSTAHVRTEFPGAFGLSVTHDFTPSSQEDLYRVDVTVSNTGLTTWSDVHYRRSFDWDVDPTPFDEFVTWAKVSGESDGFVNYTSNDGFAFPDPSEPLTHLGSEGYFTDAGPEDHGGLIDISLGDIGPDITKRFTFYYGVSTTEAAALAAIGAVGAQVYSLGQPNVPGAPETGSPVTAIFAIDGSDLFIPIETLTGEPTSGKKTPLTKPSKPHKQPHGKPGEVRQEPR